MGNSLLLFDFFKFHCKEWIFGVDRISLDNYLEKHSISLRKDHYLFILEYGNSIDLLTGGGFFYCRFLDFQDAYSHFDEYLLDNLPEHTVYFGQDWSDVPLCIDNLTGVIFDYDAMETEDEMYKTITSFLAYQFLMMLWSKGKFDDVQQNIKIHDIENFMEDNKPYHLEDFDIFSHKYYLNSNMIVELDHKSGFVTSYKGGILNLLKK